MSLAIFYGSTTGNTEEAANMIRDALGDHVQEFGDVAEIDVDAMMKHDVLILGCPTWHIGELQDDWEDFLPLMQHLDLSGKKIAFFGMGDSYNYSENFLDAFGIIWESLQKRGSPDLIGLWPTKGYTFDESKGLHDPEHFLGLGLDDENQSDLHTERVRKWTDQIRKEIGATT